MWRVLIADDEPKIRKGLRSFVEWQKYGMEVVAEAEDGLDAYDKAVEHRPDLLLVDICMPLMNGLALMEKTKAILPDCIFIVISGHDEFEYAQQAIRLQAFDFLLKPVMGEQMQAVLEKARDHLVAGACRSKYLQWAQQQLERDLPHVRGIFLNEWASGRLSWPEASEHLDFLKLRVPEQPALMVIKVLAGPEIERVPGLRDRHIMLLAVEKLVSQELQAFLPHIQFRDPEDQLVVLLPVVNPAKWASLPGRIRQAAAQCLNQTLLIEQMPVGNLALEFAQVYEILCDRIQENTQLTPVVQLAKQHIDQNYARVDLSLQSVADSLSINPAYLSRLLKQEIGISFVKYLTSVRIRQAILLMNDPSLKIYEIASRVGYANQYYFSTAFKKMLDISPLEYRKEGHRNGC